MKKCALLSLVLFLACSLAFAAGNREKSEEPEKTIEMKLGHYGAENHPSHAASLMFAKAVEERTGGKVRVAVYPNNALGAPPEVLEQVTLGVVDMTLPTQAALAKYVKKFDLVGMPFAFKDYAAADKFLDGDFIKWVKSDLENAGLVHLSNWEWGFRTFTNSKKPLLKPEDFKGLKIRTPPDFVNQATVEALGGIVQTISFTELMMALKTGVVDGQENPIGVIYSNKIYESQKYLSILNYTYASMTHVINKKAFDSLPGEYRNIIIEESRKASAFMRKAVRDEEANQIEELKKLGMEVSYPDLEPFKAAMGPAYEKLKAKVGQTDYDTFMGMLAKNR